MGFINQLITGGAHPVFYDGLNFRGYTANIWPNIWYVYVAPLKYGSFFIPIEQSSEQKMGEVKR